MGTAWICKGFQKISQNKQHGPSRSIAKLVQESVEFLNAEECFSNAVDQDAVMQAATGLEEKDVADVLDNLYSQSDGQIEDPTDWICKAFLKMKQKHRQQRRVPPWRCGPG